MYIYVHIMYIYYVHIRNYMYPRTRTTPLIKNKLLRLIINIHQVSFILFLKNHKKYTIYVRRRQNEYLTGIHTRLIIMSVVNKYWQYY